MNIFEHEYIIIGTLFRLLLYEAFKNKNHLVRGVYSALSLYYKRIRYLFYIILYNIIYVLRLRNLKSNPAYSRKPLTLKRRSAAAGPLYSWQKGTFFLEAGAESYIALYPPYHIKYTYTHYRTLATYIIILLCTPTITSSPRGYWFGLIFM